MEKAASPNLGFSQQRGNTFTTRTCTSSFPSYPHSIDDVTAYNFTS